MKAIRSFWSDTRGTTAIEYALIAFILSVGIIASLYQIAPLIEGNFTTAADAFDRE
jgi:Flp pilus assembly pilin Flp